MRIGGNARFMTDVTSKNDVVAVCQSVKTQNIPIFVIGEGSNVIVRDEGFNGLIIHMKIPGFEVITDSDNSKTIKIGAGENWDSVVKRAVDLNLSGIEAMSGIPGTAGATPIQNVGAYGQEIADTLVSVEAYDTQTNNFIDLTNEQCNFSYRNSIFKSSQPGRYIVTSLTLKLSKNTPQPPFYESLQKYLDDNNIKIYTPETIRNAVLEIRKDRVPGPDIMPSCGSFFTNAMIKKWQLDDLQKKYPNILAFQMGDGTFKIPSGWLIENAGLKGQLLHGMRIFERNALLLVNEAANGYADLASARDEIIDKVRDTFGVQISQEPIEI